MKKTTSILLGLAVFIIAGVLAYQSSMAKKAAMLKVATPVATQNTVVAPTENPTTSVVTASGYTMADVAKHASTQSCWAVVNGIVYDVTSWINKHPGGPEKIISICGRDGTSAFTGQYSGQPKPETVLASFKIGVLK